MIDYFYNEQGDYTITLNGEPVAYSQDKDHAEGMKQVWQTMFDQLIKAQTDNIKHLLLIAAKKNKPKIVCYCGSLRVAMDSFKREEYLSVQRGEIALLPCCMFVDIQREYGAESDYKQKADELHKRKIDICDEVRILNVDGYIGESTRSEIDYAISIGKPVLYLYPRPVWERCDADCQGQCNHPMHCNTIKKSEL